MKLWHGVAIVAGLALITWGIFALVKPGGELDNNKEVATQKPPSYTADQVITIAQAKYPACYKYVNRDDLDVQTTPSITVAFLGGSNTAWKVEINCPRFYSLGPLGSPLYRVTSMTEYFWEIDVSFHSMAWGISHP